MNKRIAVVGGGASGMMAAIIAAKQGAQVVIYEGKDRLGKKILATGNGKCNYTNIEQKDKYYRGSHPEFSKRARTAFSAEDTLAFFQRIGIEPKIKNGYVYPHSEQAVSVADALSMEVRALKIEVITDIVTEITKTGDLFEVTGGQGKRSFDRVILACGSCAGMKNEKEFKGYELAASFGHHITPILPALVQLRCKEKWFKTVAGVRTEGLLLVYSNEREIAREKGELLFAEYGLSGIPVFQISRFAADALYRGEQVYCKVDLLPDYSVDRLIQLITERRDNLENRTAEEMLVGLLNHKLNYILLKECGIDPVLDAKKAFRKASVIEQFVILCKGLTCHVTECNPFANAQVCAGGVDTTELNPGTMESKIVTGLYMAGELIDVDGTCGGYNLQWAWSSGYVAGFHAAND